MSVGRVIAEEIKEPTLSKSSFDLPKRAEVVQIDIPRSTIKTLSYEIDPSKITLHDHHIKEIGRTGYFGRVHGDGMRSPVMKLKSFLGIREKKDDPSKAVFSLIKGVENKAKELEQSITQNKVEDKFVLPIKMKNKKEISEIHQ